MQTQMREHVAVGIYCTVLSEVQTVPLIYSWWQQHVRSMKIFFFFCVSLQTYLSVGPLSLCVDGAVALRVLAS